MMIKKQERSTLGGSDNNGRYQCGFVAVDQFFIRLTIRRLLDVLNELDPYKTK